MRTNSMSGLVGSTPSRALIRKGPSGESRIVSFTRLRASLNMGLSPLQPVVQSLIIACPLRISEFLGLRSLPSQEAGRFYCCQAVQVDGDSPGATRRFAADEGKPFM